MAFSAKELAKRAKFLSSNACKSAFNILSPEFKILKIKRSPSSPYFPINVEDNSNEGVSIGAKPNFLKECLIVSKIYVLRATSIGKKSRVPFGIEGFWAIGKLIFAKILFFSKRSTSQLNENESVYFKPITRPI